MTKPALPHGGDENQELYDDPGLDIGVLRRRREIVLTILALLLIVSAATYAAFWLFAAPKPTREDLLAVAQRAVRQALPQELVLSFNAPAGTLVTERPDNRHEVAGNVLALTQDGQEYGYFAYACTVEPAEDRVWRPARLDLTRLY